MVKEFFPTKERVDELRSAGVFAYSTTTIRFLVFALFLILLFVFKKDVSSFFKIAQSFFNNDAVSLKGVIKIFLIFNISILIFIISLILLHSRFSFDFKNFLGFRLTTNENNKERNIVFAILYSLSVIAYLFLVYIFSMEFLSLLNNNYSDILPLIFNNIDKGMLIISCLFVFLGVLSFLFSNFSFLNKHKMSIQDIEAEKND
ncbi:MAG: EscU/YscU/HrcU family type III secretion system export apparatus switch protein [Bdellovibrionota bacterium]